MSKIFKPKMPAPVVIQEAPIDPPKVDDEEVIEEATEDMEEAESKRKGRRSTILTGPRGLTNIEEKNINKPTLLGE